MDFEKTLGAEARRAVERYAAHAAVIAIGLASLWLARSDILRRIPERIELSLAPLNRAEATAASGQSATEAAPSGSRLEFPTLSGGVEDYLTRQVEIHTNVPARPRKDVITYTVVSGDTVFGVAEKFGVTPETIVWGNPVLKDDPHSLRPAQELRIAPVSGVLRDVQPGDRLEVLANFFRVTVDDIVNWPGNSLDPDNPQLQVGQLLVVPGGRREFVQFVIPQIRRTTRSALPADAGPGQCAGGYTGGAVGLGTFIWPVTTRYVVGNNYWAGHLGLDLAAGLGQAIFAADSGVVVFAGWNNWGYGQLVVIDHGNGWQTLYAHNSQVNVSCGQSVSQGQIVALGGSTGNSSGPHLHFEMNYQGSRPNPYSYLPAP